MVTYSPTAAADIIKKPQFTEETTDGTLPTTVTGGTVFKTCGFVEQLGEDITEENNKVRPLGSYDVKKKVQMGEDVGSSIVFQPTDFNLMKYGMLLPVPPSTTPPDPTMAAPNGTVGVSISILFSALINGTEKYKVYTGVRFDGVTADISRDGGFKVTMPFKCRDVTDWVVSPTFTPAANFASDPSLTPWSGITSGADPLTVGGNVYDTTSFKFDVKFTIARPKFNGMTTFKLSKPVKRDITCSFDTPTIGGALVGDLRGYTPLNILYKITPGGAKAIQLNQVNFDSYGKAVSGDSNDIWMETFSGEATNGITLTDT